MATYFFHDNTDNTESFTNGKVRLAQLENIKEYSLCSVYINEDGKINKTFLFDNNDINYRAIYLAYKKK